MPVINTTTSTMMFNCLNTKSIREWTRINKEEKRKIAKHAYHGIDTGVISPS
jgi:hypothetical protein